MPMVWYVRRSPGRRRRQGHRPRRRGDGQPVPIDALRIPVEYLAGLFTAGDIEPVNGVLRKLAAMRSYMRDINLGRDPDASIPEAVGMGEEEMYEMFRLLAIAKYNERYVIPTAHAEQALPPEEIGTDCAVSALRPQWRRRTLWRRVRPPRSGSRSRTCGFLHGPHEGRRMTALIDRVWKRHRCAEPSWASDDVAATLAAGLAPPRLSHRRFGMPRSRVGVRGGSAAAGAGGGLTAYLSEVEATDLGVLAA